MPRSTEVTSPKNPVVHRFRDAAAGDIPGEVVLDGNRLVEEALDAKLDVLAAAWSPKLLQAKNGHELKRRLEQRAEEVYQATDQVLARMSSLTTHQGVLVLVREPIARDEDLLGADPSKALIVAATGVRDPGNLGAMVRATEAAGGTGFIAQSGGADPFRDKAVRGSAGSVLRVPIRTRFDDEQMLAFARQHGLQVLCADHRAETEYLDADWTKPTLIALGNEGSGVPDAIRAGADLAVRIPIADTIESLNVAVTTGILLFEARRQRR